MQHDVQVRTPHASQRAKADDETRQQRGSESVNEDPPVRAEIQLDHGEVDGREEGTKRPGKQRAYKDPGCASHRGQRARKTAMASLTTANLSSSGQSKRISGVTTVLGRPASWWESGWPESATISIRRQAE